MKTPGGLGRLRPGSGHSKAGIPSADRVHLTCSTDTKQRRVTNAQTPSILIETRLQWLGEGPGSHLTAN